jgi:hypothetical protein
VTAHLVCVTRRLCEDGDKVIDGMDVVKIEFVYCVETFSLCINNNILLPTTSHYQPSQACRHLKPADISSPPTSQPANISVSLPITSCHQQHLPPAITTIPANPNINYIYSLQYLKPAIYSSYFHHQKKSPTTLL